MSSTFNTSGLFSERAIEELRRLQHRTSFNLARRQFTLFHDLLPGGVAGFWLPYEEFHNGTYGSEPFYFEYQGLLFRFRPELGIWSTPEVSLELQRASNPEFSLSNTFIFNDLPDRNDGHDFSVIPNNDDNREAAAKYPGVYIDWADPDRTFINMLLHTIQLWKVQYAAELRGNIDELAEYQKKREWVSYK